MVGGGRGSNIGYIHRSSALRDRTFNVIAGAFDIVPERGIDHVKAIGLDPARRYPDYVTMFAEEAKRPDGVEALDAIKQTGEMVLNSDVQRLSPLGYEHINIVGRYSFVLPKEIENGGLRSLLSADKINSSIRTLSE